MGARQPEDMSEMFGTQFNKRDKAALLALYADFCASHDRRYGGGPRQGRDRSDAHAHV